MARNPFEKNVVEALKPHFVNLDAIPELEDGSANGDPCELLMTVEEAYETGCTVSEIERLWQQALN